MCDDSGISSFICVIGEISVFLPIIFFMCDISVVSTLPVLMVLSEKTSKLYVSIATEE